MIYTKDNIRIRPFTVNDTTGPWKNWMNDPDVTRYNSHGLFPAQKDIDKFIANIYSDTHVIWAVEYDEEKETSCLERVLNELSMSWPSANLHIGNVSLQSIDFINRSAELAIVIGNKKYWAMGISTIVCDMVIKHAFEKLNLNRVWTGTSAENIGMQQVCKKLGMQKEGVFRQGMFSNGYFVDVFTYGVLRKDIFY